MVAALFDQMPEHGAHGLAAQAAPLVVGTEEDVDVRVAKLLLTLL